MEKLKFFVVDDNEHFRKGIIFYLEQVLKHEVIGYASDGEDFLNQRDKYFYTDIILMGIQMPIIDGTPAKKHLLWTYIFKKVIAFVDFQDKVGLEKYISAGFRACVFRNRVYDDLPDAIANVMKGELHYPDNIKICT